MNTKKLERALLDDILFALNDSCEGYNEFDPELSGIRSMSDEGNSFLRFIGDCIRFSSLPIKHDEVPYNIQNGKEFCRYREELEYLIQGTEHLLFKGMASEYLWNCGHQLEHAQSAIDAYIKLLPFIENDNIKFCSVACAVCRIASKCKSWNFNDQHFWERCKTFINSYNDSFGYCTLFVILGLLECGIQREETEQLLIESISYFKEQKLYDKAISFREELIAYYKKTKQKYTQLYIETAYDYEAAAQILDNGDPKNSFRVADLLQKAMNAWKYSNDSKAKENRERLARLVRPVKEAMHQNMESVKIGSIDISNIVNLLKDKIEKASFEEAICYIAQAIKPEGMEYFRNANKSILSSLISTKMIDGKGRIRANVPGEMGAGSEEQRKICQYNALEHYLLTAEVRLIRILHFSKEKFDFNKDNLRFLIEDNLFIPKDRQETYLKGIVAGFSEDWGTAMHILMPQVENSIRCLAEACDIVVYKTDESGVEECLSLTGILRLPEFKECFEDDFIFNLECFYTSEYCFGMRDQISHGLLSDKELQNYDCAAVWGYTFYLCCLYSRELNLRLAMAKDMPVEKVKP